MKSSFAVAAALVVAPLAFAAPTAPPSYDNKVVCNEGLSAGGLLHALGANFDKPLSTAGDSLLLKANRIAQNFTHYECSAPGFTGPVNSFYGLVKPAGDGVNGTKCLGAIHVSGDSRLRLQECPRQAGPYLSQFWFQRGDDNLQLVGKPDKEGKVDAKVARRSIAFQGDIAIATNKDYGKLPQLVLYDD
ncbi:hypothetical protein CBOM_04881 [Ceraceosorus bombacis]|uniref:Ricin B lectin domain-containing protein n=1 Tax=Ceraceosorus bombacis TaxID=401625 RepID=A0A0N7LA57_9BASI|nr:hypothetical protein CBOM_04881 [Ceraceosorus bombacis]